MVQLTARHIARHGVPKNAAVIVTSPYTGNRCPVVSARECGSNVELLLENGFTMFVRATYKVDKIKKTAKGRGLS
jgi:hypothetical protein